MRHISASQIILYADCSLKYKFRYIDKIDKPAASIHLVYGSAVHKSLEMLNKSLLTKRLDLYELFAFFHESWGQGIAEQSLKQSNYTDSLYIMGIKAIEKFYNEFLDYEPLTINGVPTAEVKFDIPLNDKYTLYGVIDLIAMRKGKLTIFDYKTSKEPYDTFKIKTSPQLILYSRAFRHLIKEYSFEYQGKPVNKEEDYVSFYVLEKDYDNYNGNIKLQRRKVEDIDLKRLDTIISTMLEGIKHKIYIPNYCSECKWCEYQKECLDWS